MSEDPPKAAGASDPGAGLGALGGRYELLRELGRGGMGRVYEARHVELGRRFAVKIMSGNDEGDETATDRFRREGKLAASFEHEHIAAAFDYGHDDKGNPYIVIEYVEGESLGERLAREGPLAVDAVLEIGRQLCSALASLHERGVFHRDIKPGNVMLKRHPDGRVHIKLLDFGVAKQTAATTLTKGALVLGTVAYAAPEQLRGNADARSDLYSAGALLYHSLTGRAPFTADSLEVLYYRVLYEAPVPITELRPELPEWLATLVMRLLARDPEARPGSAQEVEQALARAESMPSDAVRTAPRESSLPVTAPTQAPPRPARLRWLVPALVVGAGLTASIYFSKARSGGEGGGARDESAAPVSAALSPLEPATARPPALSEPGPPTNDAVLIAPVTSASVAPSSRAAPPRLAPEPPAKPRVSAKPAPSATSRAPSPPPGSLPSIPMDNPYAP